MFVSLAGHSHGAPTVQNQIPDEDEEFFAIKKGALYLKELLLKGERFDW